METFTRNKLENYERDLIFQVLSWEAYDIVPDTSDDDYKEPVYKIFMFGVTEDSHSVSLMVNNFTPYYFALIPDHLQASWGDYQTKEVKNFLKKRLYRLQDSLISVSVVKKKKLKGFTNDTEYKFLKFIFINNEAYSKCRWILCPSDSSRRPKISTIQQAQLYFELYESNIDPFIRFSHIREIKSSGWVFVDKKDLKSNDDVTRCQIDCFCNWKKVSPCDKKSVCPLVTASWDIECFSHKAYTQKKNSFPDHHEKDDKITQIGTTFHRFITNETVKHVVSLRSPIDNGCDPVEGVITYLYDNEKDLIKGWVKLIETTDPDIVTGYNIYHFDWDYLYQRAKLLGIEHTLCKLSRICDKEAHISIEKLSTSAYGDNEFQILKMYGVTQLDLMFIVQREHKLESYKLNNVAKYFTGNEKDDLPPAQIFEKNMSTKDDVALVVKYCAQDTLLVVELIMKLRIITNIIAMSNIANVPIQYIELRGQQIKVHSQLALEARLESYLIPTIPYKSASDADEETEKFTGATVLEATPGAHFDPIAGLDFASLYPSIMIAHNYCYSTIVESPEFDNIPGIEYKDIAWEEDSGVKHSIRFVQNRKGLLPKMLEKLWKERKAIKRQMKTTPDKNEYDVLNGVQLAIKVTMNSIYGFTGANYGRLPKKEIAAAVTAEGRRMIDHSKKCAEEWYDCEVVYGDSVTCYTPIYIKRDGKFGIVTIDTLGDKWVNCLHSDKEYSELNDIYTWTEDGWTKLHRVIRHKLHESKKIIRIVTHTGIVDVTDDHSLLLNNKNTISPKDVNISTELLHNDLPMDTLLDIESITVEKAIVYGFFFGDGSCGIYNCKSGRKASWALNNKNETLIEKYLGLCKIVYPELSWVVYDTLKSSGVKKICPQGSLIKFIKEFRSKFYSYKSKIIPDEIINGSYDIRSAFLEGLYDSDGDKDINGYIRIDQKSQISAANIKWLFDSLGYKTSINTRVDKPNIFRITATLNTQRKSANTVKKLSVIEYEGFVYDLTTDNHHFAAGIGNIIVHNTDSIYVKFKTEFKGQEHMDEVFRLSPECSDRISETFQKPIELEFEKVMYPFILFSKKRYSCLIWTDPKKYDYIDYKGIQVVRRDNCEYVRDQSKKIFESILKNEKVLNYTFDNVTEVIEDSKVIARKSIADLVNGDIPIKKLIVSKSLRGNYAFDKKANCTDCGKTWYILNGTKKNYAIENLGSWLGNQHDCPSCKEPKEFVQMKANIPHVALARTMKERDPFNCPDIGDRVPYVFLCGDKKQRQFEKVEDPKYTIDNNLPIDYVYYFEHQLQSAIETIFDPLMDSPCDIWDGLLEKKVKRIRKTIKDKTS
jgi:DNA polymerase elongation subunit (family B)